MEEDFAATLDLVADVGFSGAFSFKYSPRPGTPGAEMTGQIDEAIKSERLQRLQQAIDESQAKFNRSCLGRTFEVLFERGGRHAGQLVGRSPYLQPVQATAPESLIGEMAAVTITEIGSNSLFGTLADRVAATTPPAPAETALVATGV
jgi:tRNA-2-methylthio-N6-dimethylallyladenosine synthase